MCRIRPFRPAALAALCALMLGAASARAQVQPPQFPQPSLPQIPNPIFPALFNFAWDSRGPFETSGAMRYVIVDPANDHKLYAAAENGGVWVLDDDQATAGWRPLSDQLENLQMRGIARSPSDPKFIVAANALGFVYHSLDHGVTWQKTSTQSFQYVRRVLLTEFIAPLASSKNDIPSLIVNHRDMWVASRTGLYRIRMTSGVAAAPVKLFPIAAGQSTDILDLAIDPSDRQTVFVGVRDQGVWRSRDGGATWKLVASTAAFGDTKSAMLKLAINPDRVVAKFGRNVFTNDANGDSGQWHATALVGFGDQDGGSDIGYRGNYSGRSGEWATGLAIHPTNKNLIVAGQASLFQTTNGGTSWTQINSVHEDIQSLAFSETGDRLYISTDGGIFRKTMASGAMSSLNKNLTTVQFFRVGVSGSLVVGNADHQGIRGTQNVDATPPVWEFATTGASGFGNDGLENDHLYADPQRAGRFLIAFEQRDVLRLRYPKTGSTEDLLLLSPPAPAAPPRPFFMRTNNNPVFNQLNYPVGIFAFDPRPNSKVILCADHESPNSTFGIRITRNGDLEPHGGPRTDCGDDDPATRCFTTPVTNTATWTRSHGPVGTPIVSLAFAATEPGKAYALDEAGAVLVKDNVDNDDAWRSVGHLTIGFGDFSRQIVSDVTTPHKLYATTQSRVMVSTNDGATWTLLRSSTVKINCLALHPSKPGYVFLAIDGDVLASPDGGASWFSTGAALPNAPVMQLITNNGWLYAATFGRGLWRTKLPV